ncbi:MAG: ATP-binding cassette domain-containing protein [Clostridiales bacterium]|jgi:energy-coupling factor transport system ATP-binding protein|nr:ATP-binding cassette domain-containing protein [Clostridiales bacterium]
MIKVKNLSHKFDDKDSFVLKDISLEIYEGELIAIMGSNGSGKSTLAKILNGLILPTEGEILVDNLELRNEKNIYKIRSKIGMVFQDPDDQIVYPIVCEDVAFGPENLNLSKNEIEKYVKDSLEKVDMIKHKNELIENLSGGQKQKVAIAGILALRSKYIIFDESVSMIDNKKELLKKIFEINKNLKKTIIYITHEINEVIEFNRIIILKDSKIYYDGNVKKILCDYNKLTYAKIDVPFSIKFNHELKKNKIYIKDDACIKKFADNIVEYYHKDT